MNKVTKYKPGKNKDIYLLFPKRKREIWVKDHCIKLFDERNHLVTSSPYQPAFTNRHQTIINHFMVYIFFKKGDWKMLIYKDNH